MFESQARWVCDRCCAEMQAHDDRRLPEGWIQVAFNTDTNPTHGPMVALHVCPACIDRVLRVLVDDAPARGQKPAGTVIAGSPRHRSALLSLFSDARRSSE